MSAPERKLISLASKPMVPDYVILRRDEVRGRWVAMAPERLIELDERSLDVLRLCDGTRSVDQLAHELAEAYDAPGKVIAGDVMAFLQDWSDRLLVKL
jgi:pyrroloquinoline quinone biosynthesis protein D